MKRILKKESIDHCGSCSDDRSSRISELFPEIITGISEYEGGRQ